jgi:hypothetical protein
MPVSPDEMQSTRESPHPWWNPWYWPAGIWVLVIAFLIFSIPFAVRTVMLAGVPAMPEPFDEVEFIRWDVPDDENAFSDYRRATKMRAAIVADWKEQGLVVNEPSNYEDVLKKGWSAADEPTEKWLEMHREILKVWRRGTEKELALNVSPADLSISSILDVVQEQRLFGRLALFEQARLMAEGRFEEAAEFGRAAFRCGGHTSHRGCLVQGLTGTALHSLSCMGLACWSEQPGVTSEQLLRLQQHLRRDYELYESRSNMLITEFLAMRNTFVRSEWLQMSLNTAADDNSAAMVAVWKIGYWTVGEPDLTARILRNVLANQMREVDKPMAGRAKLVGSGRVMLFDTTGPLLPGQLDPAGIDRAMNRSTLARQWLTSLKTVDTALLRQDARQAALEVLLGAQAYRRDQGEFPDSLSKLVPKYLSTIPLDPFSPTGAPLLYRRDDPTHAVVWSLGEDGIDGGGDVEAASGRPPDAGFFLK